MDWERLRFPGSWMLRNQVTATCGPATRFAALGYRFGDWLQDGPMAAQATVADVESYAAGYLAQAAQAGRRWGVATGIALGIAIGLPVAVLLWAWMVAR